MQTISYTDKSALNQNLDIADINKCNAADMNEIKSVVNANASETTQLLTNLGSYSTTEVNTGKTWIDNKPIYRKVINVGSLPNNSSKTVATGIIQTDIRIVSLTGVCFTSDGRYQASLNDVYSRITLVPTNNLSITTTLDFSSYTGYAILEYTKSS